MSIEISKYVDGHRNKYSLHYTMYDSRKIYLFDFDEKDIFNTNETGYSSFYKSDIIKLLKEFSVFENVKVKIMVERIAFERAVVHAIEDYYEHEFKEQFYRNQYRIYLRKKKENEIVRDMIYYEEEYGEKFNDEEHFQKWYVNIINYNYNTDFTIYNDARSFHKTEGWRKLKGGSFIEQYGLNTEEEKLLQEVIKVGFIALAKKYHPDLSGNTHKMQLLNSLKEKLKFEK